MDSLKTKQERKLEVSNPPKVRRAHSGSLAKLVKLISMKHIHLQFKKSKKKKIRLADPAENFVKVFNEIKNANRKRYNFKHTNTIPSFMNVNYEYVSKTEYSVSKTNSNLQISKPNIYVK